MIFDNITASSSLISLPPEPVMVIVMVDELVRLVATLPISLEAVKVAEPAEVNSKLAGAVSTIVPKTEISATLPSVIMILPSVKELVGKAPHPVTVSEGAVMMTVAFEVEEIILNDKKIPIASPAYANEWWSSVFFMSQFFRVCYHRLDELIGR